MELAVDLSNFFQEIFTIVVKLREFHLILVQIFINFLHQFFELLCLLVLAPSHVGIELAQSIAVQMCLEFFEEDDVVLQGVVAEHKFFMGFEKLAALI